MPREFSKQGFVGWAKHKLEGMREHPAETGVTVTNYEDIIEDLPRHFENIKEKGEPTTIKHLWDSFKEKHGLTSMVEFVDEAFWLLSTGEEKPPSQMEVEIEGDLEAIFPGIAAEVIVSTEGVTVHLTPVYTELKPGRGMPVASGRVFQYPSPLQEMLASRYFESFTEDSIEKAAEKEDMSLEKAKELAREAAERGEEIAAVEEARAEAEEASQQAEFLRQAIQDREEEIEDLEEKMKWLEEQRLAPERVEELEEKMSDLRETVDGLRKQTNKIMLESTGFGYGKPPETEEIEEVRTDIDRVEETVLDLAGRIDRLQDSLADALREIVARMQRAREVETLPEPPDILENIVDRYPDMEETPRYITTVEVVPREVQLAWDEFIVFLDTTKGIDLEELREYNRKAIEKDEPAKIIYGHFRSYVDWKKKGHGVPVPKPLSEMERKLRDFVFDAVEEQRPDLKAKAIWRSVRGDIDEEYSLEENREKVKYQLSKTEGIEFPEVRWKEIQESRKEEVAEYVKKNIREKTDQDPESVWRGLQVFYDPTEPVEDNKHVMREKMRKQFDVESFLTSS